jgi:hypothetical protein
VDGRRTKLVRPFTFSFLSPFLFLLARQLQVSHNAIDRCMETQRPTFRSHLNRAVDRTVLERKKLRAEFSTQGSSIVAAGDERLELIASVK